MTILILFYLVYLSVGRQHGSPSGMKARNNASTYYFLRPILPDPAPEVYIQVPWTQLVFCHIQNLSSMECLAF